MLFIKEILDDIIIVRIMDCFLCDGIEIIFRLALTLLTLGKHELLLLDIEGVIKVKCKNVNNCNPKFDFH